MQTITDLEKAAADCAGRIIGRDSTTVLLQSDETGRVFRIANLELYHADTESLRALIRQRSKTEYV